jgi:hypothetical protein
LEKRKFLFWNKVKDLFELPPKKAYWHSPEPGSIFYDFIMWGFCIILTNKKEGLILCGAADD